MIKCYIAYDMFWTRHNLKYYDRVIKLHSQFFGFLLNNLTINLFMYLLCIYRNSDIIHPDTSKEYIHLLIWTCLSNIYDT